MTPEIQRQRDRQRALREQNRTAPRSEHHDLDMLAMWAEFAERDRVNMPTLPAWQRGEWHHVDQRRQRTV